MPNILSLYARAKMHPLSDSVEAPTVELEAKIVSLQRMVLELDLGRLSQGLIRHRTLLDTLPDGPLKAEASAFVQELDRLITELRSESRPASSRGLGT